MLSQIAENTFYQSRDNSCIHKNLFFNLCYFHATLEGRKKYGSNGWNVAYQFDFADIDISKVQIQKLMNNSELDVKTSLKMIKYCLGDINYAGKISKDEDLKIMKAVLEQLFSEELTFC
mmetsp:Transcript_7296/g.6470  ORF Transcript_7296/g.6470 Transcript_7296/m.6470 type:complete len:119 (-) Transcript_7296:1129-1485(-)